MHKLYLNNFKGFQRQFIEITDVNFLVGENSTGKTTLINIINILNNQEFWFRGDFNIGDIQFGHFEEILSKNSSSKTFQIGMEKTKKSYEDDNVEKVFRVLLEFGAIKSLPVLKSVKFSEGNFTISCKMNDNSVKAFYKDFAIESFNDWIDYEVKGKSFNTGMGMRGLPLILMLQIISSRIQDETKIKMENSIIDIVSANSYTWLAPIRAKAKRIYESYNAKFSPEGDHIPSLLRTLLRDVKNREKNLRILEKFGKDSHLFDTIEVKDFGAKESSPFEINIKYNGIAIKLPNVGYGVSQVLPLIIEMLASRSNLYSIQQPEVHLHPKAQAAFGSFLYKSCINEKHSFLIETHSDYTINRFRYIMSNDEKEHNLKCQILFFKRTPEGNQIIPVEIGPKGNYRDNVPEDYTEFFIDEELKLLEL